MKAKLTTVNNTPQQALVDVRPEHKAGHELTTVNMRFVNFDALAKTKRACRRSLSGNITQSGAAFLKNRNKVLLVTGTDPAAGVYVIRLCFHNDGLPLIYSPILDEVVGKGKWLQVDDIMDERTFYKFVHETEPRAWWAD